ncbi:MAG: hypothetical protein JSS14_15325 [Proteobacteria bacterium]|nr:hypothetical protein [Pseudomonadota bacterium]
MAQSSNKARYVDKLTDDTGKYAVAPLPFAFDALEPFIDARTVELHYTFHRNPAATAASLAPRSNQPPSTQSYMAKLRRG